MKILYDHQAFSMQSHGGVSKSFVELITHLPGDIKYDISINENDNIYLKENKFICEVRSYEQRLKEFAFSYKFKGKRRIFNSLNSLTEKSKERETNLSFSIRLIKKGEFDVFHPTFFDDYFLKYLRDKPFILTIHDMIPELFPQYFKSDDYQIEMKKKLAPLATQIIAVSENTKRDIVNLLNINENKISVIYHGAPEIKNEFSEKSPYPFPYILYVGQRWEYKNFNFLLRNFALLAEKDVNIHLLCTSEPFNVQEKELINKYNLQDRIVHSYVNQQELFNLYHHALVFVYPSEYEGFGIPILEAFACGCPVMLNNSSCFPEIGGDAAIYFDISEKDTNFIERYNQAILNREYLIKKGFERGREFSWTKSSEKLSLVYKNCIQ